MKRLLLILGVSIGGMALAASKIPKPKAFSIGMGKPQTRVVRGASTVTSASTLTVARQTVHMGNDGTTMIDLVYITPGGQQIVTRQITVAPGCGIVTDAFGVVLATTAPTALCNAITNFGTQIDAVIGSAATGGKLNL